MAGEDHYAVLGLPSGIEGTKLSTTEIRKAYFAKALECHPDKRPDDPKAAELFQTIQTSYEFLMDKSARKAFDELLRLKQQQLEKENKVSAKRRKMMDRLSEEERAFASNTMSQHDKDKEEIERVRKKIEEEIARIVATREKKMSSSPLKKDDFTHAPSCSSDREKIIEVTWRHSKEVSDIKKLQEFFSKFGVVENVVIQRKKALVVMTSREAVVAASRSVRISDLNALRVCALCPMVTVPSSPPGKKLDGAECPNLFQLDEDSVLQKLKLAAERQRANAVRQDSQAGSS